MEAAKPLYTVNSKFLWRILRQVLPYRRQFIILFGLSILSSLVSVLPPLLLRYAIDRYILQQDLRGMMLMLLALVGLGCLIALQNYTQRRLSQYVGLNIVKNLRNDLFEHISQQPFEFFDKTATGDVVARVTSDTNQLTRFLNQAFISFVINIFMLIGVFVILFLWDYRFGLIYLALFPPILYSMRIFTQKIMPINRKVRKMNGVLFSSIQECFNGIREVKLYGREAYMQETLEKWNGEYFDAVIDANKYNAKWGPFVPMLLNIFSVFAIMLGCILYIDNQLTVGQIVAAIMYFGMIGGPIRAITGFANTYNSAKAAAERIYDVMEMIPSIKDSENAIPLENVRGAIDFIDVTFGYREKTEILRHISLKITPGELIALVGPSGVGKTTIVHLIPRFYDATSGSVSIDGIDIKNYQLQSLRKNVGIVMQNVFLFDGTIGENIAYGREDATPEEIEKAARIAQLHDFIQSLPNKYDTRIGERGVKLSGGQMQRISIARVLLIEPKILILDEPTANVDAVTDERLIQAVENVMKGRTTLVIAHRLWTIKNADRIILLKEGQIEAIGKHHELLESSAFYKEFFASQFQREANGGSKK